MALDFIVLLVVYKIGRIFKNIRFYLLYSVYLGNFSYIYFIFVPDYNTNDMKQYLHTEIERNNFIYFEGCLHALITLSFII